VSVSVELLLRSPLVAARRLPPYQSPTAELDGATEQERKMNGLRLTWDASTALGVLAAAGAALRPHGCDAVTWQPQRRSVWLRPDDPARGIEQWLGHPATGAGVLWAAWHRWGQPLAWSADPADNGPVRHFMAVSYAVNGAFPGDAEAELHRWCTAMGPQLAALDGWVRDPERGHCAPWQGGAGLRAAADMPAPGAGPG